MHQPEIIQGWLSEHKHQQLRITKYEENDQDITEMKLQKVTIAHHQDPEEYLSGTVILLNGEGWVQTAAGSAPLPGNTYELALTDHWSVDTTDTTMHLQTDRARYTITVQN